MVRPQTPSSTPPEPHPPAGQASYIEANMPHAHTEANTSHVDDDDNTASVPLSGTHPPVTMIPPLHHPYQPLCPHLSVDQPEEGVVLPFPLVNY